MMRLFRRTAPAHEGLELLYVPFIPTPDELDELLAEELLSAELSRVSTGIATVVRHEASILERH